MQSRNYAQPPVYLPSVLPDITPHVTRFPIRSILHTKGGGGGSKTGGGYGMGVRIPNYLKLT